MYIVSGATLTGNQDLVKLVLRAIREIVAISDELALKADDLTSQEMHASRLGRGGVASVGHSAGGQRLGSASSSNLEEE